MAKLKINLLEEFWKGYTNKIQTEVFRLNTLIKHPGEKGSTNERVLIDLIKGFLPSKRLRDGA